MADTEQNHERNDSEQSANDDQALECLEWYEQLLQKGFTKGELSMLAGYRSESGLGLCVRRVSFPQRVHSALRRLHAAAAEDPASTETLRKEARQRVKAKRRSSRGHAPAVPENHRQKRETKDSVSRPQRLAGIVDEPPAGTTDAPAQPPGASRPRAERNDSIWDMFEIAKTGVGSAHRTIRAAKERFGNPLTNAGLDAFIKRLDELDRDMERVLDACR